MFRTFEQWQQHLKRVKNCGNGAILLYCYNDLFGYYMLVRKRCKSDFCEYCRRMNLVRLRIALLNSIKKKSWRLVTLTFEQAGKSREEILLNMCKVFDKFMKRVKRRYPKLSFARTLEIHESGFPHIHLIVSRYIPQAFLQIQWKECGGGFASISRSYTCKKHKIKNCTECKKDFYKYGYIGAVKYLTEEFEKTLQDPHRLGYDFFKLRRRSFACSRDLKLKNENFNYKFIRSFEIDDFVKAYIMENFFNSTFSRTQNTIKFDSGFTLEKFQSFEQFNNLWKEFTNAKSDNVQN